jgi:hypothetical protein
VLATAAIQLLKDVENLGDSGKYKVWKKIQSRLVKSGHKRAPELLDGNKIRRILDAQCRSTRRQHVVDGGSWILIRNRSISEEALWTRHHLFGSELTLTHCPGEKI